MTNTEFSDAFDTLLNSHNIQAGFGEGSNKQAGAGVALDEYEKSVLLTQAQDIIVKSYFDRTLNQQGQGFDDTARRQVDFSSLIKVARFSNTDSEHKYLQYDAEKCYDDRGLIVNLGADKKILFILNERLEVVNSDYKRVYVVVPINYREYDREMSKAYAQPLKKQAWRLFSNNTTGYDIDSEIIPIYGTINNTQSVNYYQFSNGKWIPVAVTGASSIKGAVSSKSDLPSDASEGDIYRVNDRVTDATYVIRYVQRPTPIILRKLPNDLKIDGYDGSKNYDGQASNTGMECSLNPILHMDILNKAFELAVTTRGGGTAQLSSRTSERQ